MSKNIMQMCADEIAGYLKRIADLENQLQDWQDGTIIAQWQDCEQKVKELEKQLAEKDTQIQSQKKNLEFFYDVFNNSESYQTFSDINQAKTDFAIECLEKVRNEIDNADKTKSYFEGMEEWSKDKRDYFDLGFSDCQDCIWDVIDWQIQELRG